MILRWMPRFGREMSKSFKVPCNLTKLKVKVQKKRRTNPVILNSLKVLAVNLFRSPPIKIIKLETVISKKSHSMRRQKSNMMIPCYLKKT